MKVAVSYLSSIYNLKKTINLINKTDADYIHMDIMDGKYVDNKNFSKGKIKKVLKYTKKDLDIHLMVNNPSKYLKLFLKNEYVRNLFFHPSTEKDPYKFILDLKKYNISPGIVINPKEDIEEYLEYFKYIDRVLIMSVTPGAGGQKFITSTIFKLEKLIQTKKEKKEIFEIAVDGGINDKTINKLKDLKIDYVISGSFICHSDDYDEKINVLKN